MLQMFPVDVISLSSVDGKVTPLKIRIDNGKDEVVVGKVSQILSSKASGRFGVENRTFLCRVCCQDTLSVMELKYVMRENIWYMSCPGR